MKNNLIVSKNIIEALIFVSGEPVNLKKIKEKLSINEQDLRTVIDELKNDYTARGINILEFENSVEMVTSSDVSVSLSDFIKSELQEDLSQAALETLAIIAYMGPVGRARMEDIRGVNCVFILRNLLIRGLVRRENSPESARSFIYSVTSDFLKKLGIQSVKDLPEYGKYNDSKKEE